MISVSQLQVAQAALARVGMIGADQGAEGSQIPAWCTREGLDWDAVVGAAMESARSAVIELMQMVDEGQEFDFETEITEMLATEFRQGLLTGFVAARRDASKPAE